MAWQARIESITTASADVVNVNVVYFDDAITDSNGPVVQAGKSFQFPNTTTLGQMQAQVLAYGVAARASYNRVQTLLAAAPVGTLIPVP